MKNEKLKKLLQQSIPFIGQRLRVLLILKQKQERHSNTSHYFITVSEISKQVKIST
jgi:hypothetical protein